MKGCSRFWAKLLVFTLSLLACVGFISVSQVFDLESDHRGDQRGDQRGQFPLLADDELLQVEGGYYDVLLFEHYVSQARVYLEYGSGGSTTLAAALAGQVYSIENSEAWCKNMTEVAIVRRAIDHGVLSFACVTPAAVGNWGYPIEKADYSKFSAYVTAPDAMGLQQSKADVILLDGRFRVACALNAMRYMKESSILMFHDFWDRASYFEILQYYDVIDGSPTRYLMWRHLLDRFPLQEVLSQNFLASGLNTTQLQKLSHPFKSSDNAARALQQLFGRNQKQLPKSVKLKNGREVVYRTKASTMAVLKLKPQYLKSIEDTPVEWKHFLSDSE